MATAKFVADFLAVSTFYLCTPDEVEEMKQCARENMADATISFAAMAHEAMGAAE